jgi:GTP-binding protein
MEAEFLLSAARPEQFPAESLPEIAFLGRSNVGKSSLLNALTGKRELAFTSAKPGCTQVINFYRVENQFHFVDLPGYGFARVPAEIRSRWQQLIESYLEKRKTLELCFLVLDSRRGWMDKDVELRKWLEFHRRPYLVVATKTDKLKSQKEQHHGLAGIRSERLDHEPVLFSAVTGRGVREIWQAIWNIRNSSNHPR